MPKRTTRSIRGAGLVIGCALTVVAAALLNRGSAGFEVASGVTLLFPASALTVLAALFFGWWGVVAAFVGLLLGSWGLSTTFARAAYFAAAAALQGAVPAAARLLAEGPTWRRFFRAVTLAAVANTATSAAVGVPMAVHLAGLDRSGTFIAFSSWFLGDMMAIVLLAFPAILAIRPGLLLEPIHEGHLQSWVRRWRLHVATGAFLVAWLTTALAAGGIVSVHWLAPLLLIPVFAASIQGSLGAGLIVNGAAGVAYLVAVLLGAGPTGQIDLFRELFSSYANLVMLTAAAIAAGLYSARSLSLVAELDEHRRLLQEGFERVVTALAAAIEAKDRNTEGHVQRVARRAVGVGRKLGLTGNRLELLRYAAILHDVGKIGVPEEILNKPGPLTDDERALVERHVEIGVEIIAQVDILQPAIPFIRYHQERWDGITSGRFRGYFGLKGDEIPLEARIIAVVDAFDAMVSDRPYQQGRERDEAFAELRREAGAQFDPRVVDAFIELVDGTDAGEASDRWPVLGPVAPEWLNG